MIVTIFFVKKTKIAISSNGEKQNKNKKKNEIKIVLGRVFCVVLLLLKLSNFLKFLFRKKLLRGKDFFSKPKIRSFKLD